MNRTKRNISYNDSQSFRLEICDSDLNNVNLRSRNKQKNVYCGSSMVRNNEITDSGSTHFENESLVHLITPEITSDESICKDIGEISEDKNEIICYNKISTVDNSTNSFDKKINDCCVHGNKSKTASKSLFNSTKRNNEKCTCNKIVVVANLHHNNYSFHSNKNLNNDKNTKTYRFSECENSSSFHPPYTSTKVYKTPVNSNEIKERNLLLSGIKQLKRSIFSEEICILEKSYNNIQFDNEILPAEINRQPDMPELDDDLPCTQPVATILLRDVVAFVDVKIGKLQLSDSLKQQLINLGASVEDKFTRKVTHVIFKDGNLSTYKKAKQWKVPLVNLMWINDCATSLACLPISNYVPSGLDKYEAKLNTNDKDIFDLNRKPKFFSAAKPRIKNEMNKKLVTSFENLPRNNQPNTPEYDRTCRFNLIEEYLNNLGGEIKELINRSESPHSSEDIHIPVPISLLRKCITPRKARTDIKSQPLRIGNVNSMLTERKKNLNDILSKKKLDMKIPENNDKENVNNIPKATERKSAPSFITDYIRVSKKKVEIFDDLKIDKIDEVNAKNENNINGCENSETLTQVTRKRQLLSLNRDLILDAEINSSQEQPIKNPYGSPARKSRKIVKSKTPSTKKNVRKDIKDHRSGVKGSEKKTPKSKRKRSSDISRRSSSVFFTNTKKSAVKNKMFLPTIVCTGVSEKTVETVRSVVNVLGKYEMANKVSERTTHVIVERENFRTINLLKGIVRGCWIVSVEWVYTSLSSEKWISEEQFEITSFSPAVRLNRYDRQAFGPEYSFELFNKLGTIYISSKCSPPSEDLKELIRLSSGNVTENARSAALYIGGNPSLMNTTPRVSEKWVLDCISQLKVLDFEEYLIHSLRLT